MKLAKVIKLAWLNLVNRKWSNAYSVAWGNSLNKESKRPFWQRRTFNMLNLKWNLIGIRGKLFVMSSITRLVGIDSYKNKKSGRRPNQETLIQSWRKIKVCRSIAFKNSSVIRKFQMRNCIASLARLSQVTFNRKRNSLAYQTFCRNTTKSRL